MEKKIKKKKKQYDKRKFVSKIQKEGKIVQIDTKYIKLGRKTVYQFTAVDLATRYSWREIYEDKTSSSALSFLKYVLKTVPFKIQSIQTATEGRPVVTMVENIVIAVLILLK